MFFFLCFVVMIQNVIVFFPAVNTTKVMPGYIAMLFNELNHTGMNIFKLMSVTLLRYLLNWFLLL